MRKNTEQNICESITSEYDLIKFPFRRFHDSSMILRFHEISIPNTLREIEFSFKKPLFAILIRYNQIQVVYWMLKSIRIQSVGI